MQQILKHLAETKKPSSGLFYEMTVAIAQVLAANPTLAELNLQSKAFSLAALAALLISPTLTSLSISWYPDMSQRLAIVSASTKLRSLTMTANFKSIEEAALLAANISLLELSLEGITQEGILAKLAQHKTLTSLRCDLAIYSKYDLQCLLSNTRLISVDIFAGSTPDNELVERLKQNRTDLRARQYQFLLALICLFEARTLLWRHLNSDIWRLILNEFVANSDLGKAKDQTYLVLNSFFSSTPAQIRAKVKSACADKSPIKLVVKRDDDNREIASLVVSGKRRSPTHL